MKLTEEFIEAFLYEEENTSIDFKRDQYKFENSDDYTKGELLKDILAFANSWRRSDAYIIIGVIKAQGNKGNVIGITSHIDDAKIQQFINSKTQKPVKFSYQAVKYKGLDLGIINIRKQERPIYLVKDFGKLKKNEVYIRRGSSTDIATLEEVSKMGTDDSQIIFNNPQLDICFYDSKQDKVIGHDLNTNNLIIEVTDAIPDYKEWIPFGNNLSMSIDTITDKSYWRDLVEFISFFKKVKPVEFALINLNEVPGNNIGIEMVIQDPTSDLMIYTSTRQPSRPKKNPFLNMNSRLKNKCSYTVDYKQSGHWKITTNIEYAHPMRTIPIQDFISIGSRASKDFEIKATIYAANLTKPLEIFLNLKIIANHIDMSWQDFLQKYVSVSHLEK